MQAKSSTEAGPRTAKPQCMANSESEDKAIAKVNREGNVGSQTGETAASEIVKARYTMVATQK